MNLILITADELRADACGFMGNPDCRTPHLDRFAARALVFDRHFAPSAKCVPSRVAMLTGRYCHTDGIRAIHEECHLPPGAPNLLPVLRQAGYQTACFGHNHVWQDFWGDNRPGSGATDYHSYTAGEYAALLNRAWPVPPDGPAPILAEPVGNLAVQRYTRPLEGFCDDNRSAQAIHYLRQGRDRSRPFYLHLNLGKPHPPYGVEEPYFSQYDREALAPWPHELPAGASLPLRKQREIRTPAGATAAHFRQVQAVYYGMVTKVDTLLGQVFAALDAEDLWADSVVLFTSDHGDFAGQFGLPEKWDTVMHDCLLHVPFVLWAPGRGPGWQTRVGALSDHTDLLPTLLELLGLRADWGVHGESLLPVWRGERRRAAVFADGGHEAAMRARFDTPLRDAHGQPASEGKQQVYHDCPDTMARTRMIRTERWKLVVREIADHELYDLAADPGELNNLWGRPEHAATVQELLLALVQWDLRTDPDRPRVARVGA